MPRYATGIAVGTRAELYDIADHATDIDAVRVFEAEMLGKDSFIRLVWADVGEFELIEFVGRVSDGFPLDGIAIDQNEIVEWIALYRRGGVKFG